jgi:hypothetical protein
VEVDGAIRDKVLQARTAGNAGWNDKTVADLLEALTQLAARLKPVTAESLKACHDDTRAAFRIYGIMSICMAIVIVSFSAVSFTTTFISKAISQDIATANDLAAKLRTQLGAPPPPGTSTNDPSQPPPGLSESDVITELQQYASTIRAVDTRARQLNRFVFPHEKDPFAQVRTNLATLRERFQLDVGLTNLVHARDSRTATYQEVRSFAQSVVDGVSCSYGAFAASVLPVLYALLGTCAYLLRSFEQQMMSRTFIASPAYSARFLIAAIGGAVVGLFNFTITQGASIPPLAIAFMVGYAVDVFFAFLEGLIQAFTKRAPPP